MPGVFRRGWRPPQKRRFAPPASSALSARGTAMLSGRTTLTLKAQLAARGTAQTSGKLGQISTPLPLSARGAAMLSGRATLTLQALLAARGTGRTSGRVTGPLANPISLAARGTAQTSGNAQFQRHAILSARTSFQAKGRAGGSNLAVPIDGSPAARTLTDVDPLWVAAEFDLAGLISAQPFTLRLSNRGSLQRVVGGTLYPYAPRLQVPIVVGTRISISTDYSSSNPTPFYQQPLRGQPNNGQISWTIDPDVDDWAGPLGSAIIGRTFRLYEGLSDIDTVAFVDDLDLVYTGHVTSFSFDLTASPPTATIGTTDASSDLDRTLVDRLYPADHPIVALRGLPRPRLAGRALSIQPTLIDQASLTYEVTHDEGFGALDDVTELRVGGVPWRRAAPTGFSPDLTPTLANLLAQYAALPGMLQSEFDSVVGSDPANFNNGAGLQNKVNLVALLTAYNGLTAGQRTDFDNAVTVDPALYNNTPGGVLNKLGLAGSLFAPADGTYSVDPANGTVTLGSVPGADVRVDAQAVGWATLTTAGLIRQICATKGVPIDPASMAQLDADWGGLVGYYTDTNPVNCLDVLDRITAGNVCTWWLGPDGAVNAQSFDAPALVPDLLFVGSPPGVPLDINLLPPPGFTAVDPVPKEMATLAPQGLLTPAYRARVGYARRQSPETSFLGGVTDQEQANLSTPELVLDWYGGLVNGFQLSPTDGATIRATNPRAQDVYVSSIAWRDAEATALRTRLVQRVIGNVDHALWDTSVRMRASRLRMMQTVQVIWVDQNDRTQALYGGSFRITSTLYSLGGGAQQLELWGLAGGFSGPRASSTAAPAVGALPVPTAIAVTPFDIGQDAAGTVVANLSVSTLNGGPFSGALGFGPPHNNDGGTVAPGGNFNIGYTVVLARDLGPSDVGTHSVTVTATAYLATVSASFTFTVT